MYMFISNAYVQKLILFDFVCGIRSIVRLIFWDHCTKRTIAVALEIYN